jgi:DNA uptake protein ComE-like DNA-binding protein
VCWLPPSSPVAAAAVTAHRVPPTPSRRLRRLVDINSANKEELKALPVVTDEVTAKIIAGRP